MNGGFDSAALWSAESPWTISGGVANGNGGSGADLSTSILTIGNYYKITFTINRVSGVVRVRCGSTDPYTDYSASGTYTIYKTCSGNTNLIFTSSSAFVGTIDNVSVQQVIYI